ncbi:PREDICTED: WD repeat-containing protein 78 [Gavialis gangeticus]|uniref:WD repeat-containing protein 78 n=1 Tax=Gavialis gangeticus TaxID=94835 RepID=UPI00092E49AB|nr:PREDICTED: WD repeat-containing protein 78 [Gavialis gangeticus]
MATASPRSLRTGGGGALSGPAGGRSKWHSAAPSLTSKMEASSKKGSISGSGSQRQTSYISSFRVGSMSRKNILVASDGKTMDKGSLIGSRHTVQVFDEQGKDVTPHPLYRPEPSSTLHRQTKILSGHDFSGTTTTDFLASLSLHQTSGINASLVGPFSRTYGSSSISKSTISTTESMADEIVEPGSRRDTVISLSDVQVRREEVREHLTKEDLEKRAAVHLTETETLWILDMPTVMVSVESEEAEKVQERNKAYIELCKHRTGNDRFVERMIQTLNGAPKNKEVQCDKILTEDKGIIATSWDLYDSFNALETTVIPSITGGSRPTSVSSSKSVVTKDHDHTTSTTSTDRESTHSSIIDLESVILAKIQEEEEDHSEAILKSEKFQQDLFVMERILMENVFQAKLAAYRQLPVLIEPALASHVGESTSEVHIVETPAEAEEEEADREVLSSDLPTLSSASFFLDPSEAPEEVLPPSLERLWSYTCDLTSGHNVSSMAWNKLNPDLLAVGYGQFGFKEQKKGLACCWSLKNPMWPERIYHCDHGVTALDFSVANPNLLAVGMYNGTVAIFNVQSRNPTAVMDSSESLNKHIGPVWQLKWIEQDRGTTGDDKGEVLISICADGRITKWLTRKGLGCTDLLKLKRIGNERKKITGEKEKKSEALISRQAPGMCFDFHPKDTNIYLAGTEEGHIHKCSCSYNEQFLETYRAHKGPVYKIAWNPFSTDMFLSCSADWSIILWCQDSLKPHLIFSSTTTVVHDIMWSPKSAFIFAAVNESRVEIWDLSVSTLDPLIISYANPGVKFTTLLFAKNTDCLLIGDSMGQVSVYELRNLTASDYNKGEAFHDIISSALANGY